jgi:carboxyl-terminal processing protease
MRIARSARAIVLAMLAATACAPAPASVGPRPVPTDLALTTFDTAWRIVYETHFDTTFNGVDWLALREELRPRLEGEVSEAELRATIGDMLGRLGQSHFALIPREVADTLDPAGDGAEVGDAGLDVRLVGDDVLVSRVDEGGAAWEAGIRPGWIVTTVGDEEVADIVSAAREVEQVGPLGPAYIVHARVLRRTQGPPGTVCHLRLIDGEGVKREIEVKLLPTESQPVKLGNMPTFFSRFESEERSGLGVRAGVIWFNYWMVPLVRSIDEAIDRYRDADGIVIDLRGNPGGVGAMVAGIAGHFLDEPISLGVFRTRNSTLDVRANPRRVAADGRRVEPFAGPLAILTDEQTGSASEVFAGGMQSIGRARLFGLTTAGAVLPATMDRLPNGDVLYHAFAEFTTPEGVTLEARGVVPDERVPLTRDDLLSGRDAALEAALRWIAETRRETGAP